MQNGIRFSYRSRSVWMLSIWIVLNMLLVSGCAIGQPHVYRVGILAGASFFTEVIDGFKTRMSELGYIENQNISYDIQYTDMHQDAYARVLHQFVINNVDLIFAFPTDAALAAKAATQGTDIPVVFGLALTEGSDLIESVSRPGGNITGVRYPGPDVALKRFEVMHALVPAARRIGIPYQRDYPTVASQLALLYPAAASADVALVEISAANVDELATALAARAATSDASLDAIIFLAEPFGVRPDAFAVIAQFAMNQQIPMGGSFATVDGHGSIFGISSNNAAAGQQAAGLAHKIFTGTPAGTIPTVAVEMRLRIDYTRAQDLGITVPAGLLHQADEVIH